MKNIKAPIAKNEEYIVDIIDYGMNGEGIAKINDFTIFINYAIKGEKCKIHITKVLANYAYAKLVEIIKASEYRVNADCEIYNKCGGCSLRHIDYNETLKIKRQNVQNLVNKNLNDKNKIVVNETIGMKEPYYYRNKTIYPVNQNKEIGFYSERSHNIITFNTCKVQTLKSQEIARFVLNNYKGSIYDENNQTGLLRNIMIKEAFATNELMLVLVQTGDEIKIDIEKIITKYPDIKTIIININNKNTNVVLSDNNKIIYGDGYIVDELNDIKFKIYPNSFYQVNPVQTKVIYDLVKELAQLEKDDIVCDLYCGIGTIGLSIANCVKKVYGIEIVQQAINAANENAKINKINNVEFLQGDVEETFENLLDINIKPNVVIVDPPRKGLDNKTIENLCKLKLDKLIYVSCNPATLVRDLKKLQEIYDIKSITPVDNFCYSSHIECVTIMKLK